MFVRKVYDLSLRRRASPLPIGQSFGLVLALFDLIDSFSLNEILDSVRKNLSIE